MKTRVLTDYNPEQSVPEDFEAGAKNYRFKDTSTDEILLANGKILTDQELRFIR
jgi:DNA-binding NarL/FixJ family response regulator